MVDRADDALNAGEEGEEGGFNAEVAKELLGFVSRAPRRHPALAGGAFLVVATLGVTVAIVMPKTYNSTARLLAQKTAMLPALGNPGLTLRDGDFAPTKDLADVIRRRENIEELVKEGNLLERTEAARVPALRLKDKIFTAIFGPLTEEQKTHGLVGVLEKKLTVTSDDSSVTISVDWAEPNQAYTIVNLVQKHLVEAKYDTEVAMIEDTISLLEDHAKQELDQVDSALADLKGLQTADLPVKPTAVEAPAPSGPRAAAAPVVPIAVAPRRAAAPDADLTEALQEKRQQIKTFEDDRQRTLDGLKQQLMQAQLTLTAMHPTVVALQQKVDDFSQPSPELARLKAEERAIVTQIAAATDSTPSAGTAAIGAARPFASPTVGGTNTAGAAPKAPYEDPALAAPHERLSRAIGRYQDVMARIEGAKLQLDISKTAYQYRYRVITPAEVAIAPKKPISQIVGIASVLGALLIAYLAAALSDWSKGILLETWQVRRMLKLDVLTELDPPA